MALHNILQNAFLGLLLTFTTIPIAAHAETKTLVVAGGCFWCVESDFDHVKGVISTTSGYAGGDLKNPTYENHEGNQEAVKVEYDPAIISYDKLISGFLRTIDVTDSGGQFCDRGNSYVSAIWTMNDAEKVAAEKAIKDGEAELGKKIVTPVKPFTTFTPAEDYHQNYYLGQNRVLTRFGWVKQSYAYEQYRLGCGRDAQVKAVWGKDAYPLQMGQK
ncbi:MAG: peptide-methionine (S)-S-oxide reductase MsrA [Alphaproteobacteria bacterium]|nr:peptide-methionine (S)-S-oxide reductase MsrA [Alphaproteobacteria bacterium]